MRFTDINIRDDITKCEYYNKKIAISDKEGKPLRFQIPRMYMPFGLSGFTPEIGPTKWNIDFSMKGWDEEGNYIKKFYDFIKSVEDYFITHIEENSMEIFGRENVNVRDLFNSNIKEDTSGREPKFRIKVDADQSNKIKPRFFDVNENDVTKTAEKGLYSKHSGVSLVELNSVYFLNKMCGFTWKLCQMKVYEPQRLKGFQFNIEENNDDNVEVKGFQFKI